MAEETEEKSPTLRKPLGEIFVERGLLTRISIERMVESSRSRKVRLGTFLENVGLITPEELADALAVQYRCRRISDFAKFSYPPPLLRLIPIETAVEHTVFPLKLDGKKLGLAVWDPTTESVYEDLAKAHGVEIVRFVATRADISRAIARHYMATRFEDASAKTILLVEDDALARKSIMDILAKHGYSVDTAVDGMEAFKKIFTQNPRLVITDKVMPKLNGYEFLDAVRKIPEFKYTPMILVTGSSTPDEEKTALEKGFFDIVLKPVREIGLVTRVKRAFESMENLYGKGG